MNSAMRVALAMGVNGDDPRAFACLAADLGFGDIVVNHQLHDTPDVIQSWKEIFDGAGLRVASWSIPYLNTEILIDAVERKRALSAVERGLENLESIGVASAHTFVMLHAGGSESDRRSRWECMIEIGRGICRVAADRGIRVAHHFGWTDDQLIWSTQGMLRFLDEVGAPNCGILFCSGSVFSSGDDVIESARRLADRIFLVHARDSRKVSPECEGLHLGQGSVPHGRLLETLRDSGYRGVVVAEHLGPAAGQRREEIAQAMAAGYLRGLLEGIEKQ